MQPLARGWQNVASLLMADLAREGSSFSVPLASDIFHLQHLLHYFSLFCLLNTKLIVPPWSDNFIVTYMHANACVRI